VGDAGAAFPVGSQWRLGGLNPPTLVFRTGRPARTDDHADVSDLINAAACRHGLRSLVGVPITVEGRLWGVMLVGSTRQEPLPAGTEARLAGFTELAGTAIANTQARVELGGFADEQAAPRRVATLVARGAPLQEVFAAVTEEAGRLLGAQHALLSRYGPDGGTVVASWSRTGAPFPLGTRWIIGGQNLHSIVFLTRRPARIDDYVSASGPAAQARRMDVRSGMAVPISAEGRLWGVLIVGSAREEPLPAGTEARLAGPRPRGASSGPHSLSCDHCASLVCGSGASLLAFAYDDPAHAANACSSRWQELRSPGHGKS
jgi:GAF domain-containing protein